MKIAVTGGRGQLGLSLQKIADEYPHHRFFFTDRDEADITDREAMSRMLDASGAEAVINCAAYTAVDRAENDRDEAERINAEGPAILARLARDRNIPLLQISTDYVFSGELKHPLREEERPAPRSVYGETKLAGEQAVIASGCRYLIIRTAWLYSEYGKNFLKTMLNLTGTKPEVKVVFDQTGTPTYALDLAEVICRIIGSGNLEGKYGIYHYSNEGVCSWYDFTKMIAEFSGHTGCRILPCHSSEFPSKVVRPSYSVLDKTKIKETFGVEIPYWTDSLKKCIGNLGSE